MSFAMPAFNAPCLARIEPPQGWMSPDIAPPAGGVYERLTPCLGITEDVWDEEFCCWRRAEHRVERIIGSPYNGVICANQALPWRRPR